MAKPHFRTYEKITVNGDNTVEVQTKQGIQRYHSRNLKHGFVPESERPAPMKQ